MLNKVQGRIALLMGWALARNVRIHEEVYAIYARVLGASKGEISLNEALFVNDEFQICCDTHDIEGETLEDMRELERDFEKMFKSPPAWWADLAHGSKTLEGRVAEPHLNRVSALEYARDHAVCADGL